MSVPDKGSPILSGNFSLGQAVVAHGGVYTFSQLANQAMGFVLLPVYARLLRDEGFAVLSLLSVLGMVLTLVMAQGLPGAWYRFRFDKKNKEEVRVFESTIIWYLLGIAPLFIVILSVWGEGFARLVLPGVHFYPLIFLTLLAAVAGIFPALYERKLQAEQKPVQYAIFSGSRTLATLLLIILFVVGFKRGVQGKIEADLISFGFFALVMLFLVRLASPLRLSLLDLKQSLSYGLPLVPHSLAGWTNNMIDRFIVNLMLGLSATGVYSMGYQIAGLAMILGVSLNQAYTPIIFQSFKQIETLNAAGKPKEADKIFQGIARISLLLVAIVVCFSFFLSSIVREALIILTTQEFDQSWTVVAPVTAGMIAMATYFIFVQPIFYSLKLVRFMFVITAIGSIINILVNICLIPIWGILGSAMATIVSNIVLALLAYRIGTKSPLRIPYVWARLWGLWGISAVGLAGLWLLDRQIEFWYHRLPLKLILLGFLVIVIIRITGFSVKEIKEFGGMLLAKAGMKSLRRA